MSRALFWVGGVSGGGWDIILGERGWVKKYFGLRGMSGDLCTV